MSKQLLLLLIVSLIYNYSICQENDNHIKRNVIKGSVASSGIFNGMIFRTFLGTTGVGLSVGIAF